MRNGMRNGIHRSHGGGHGGGSHPSVEVLSQMGYETRDVSLPALFKWLSVLLLFIIGSTVGMKFLYNVLVPTYAEQLNQPMPHQRHVPPFPQVQADPKHDMMAYRTAEDRVLEGQAAMPGDQPGDSIDQAMATLATKTGIAGVTDKPVATPKPGAFPGGGDYNDNDKAGQVPAAETPAAATPVTTTPAEDKTPPAAAVATTAPASPSPAAEATP